MQIKDKNVLNDSINTLIKDKNIIISTISGTLIITVTITLYFHPKTIWDIFINILIVLSVLILILAGVVYFIYKKKLNEKLRKEKSFKDLVELCQELNDR